MLDKLEALERRHAELSELLVQPATIADNKRFRELSKEHSQLARAAQLVGEWRKAESDLAAARAMQRDEADAELREMAAAEVAALEARLEVLAGDARLLLVPPDPNAGKNVIVEIRAGTGGEESALFAADLFRMYVRWAEERGQKTDLISAHETGLGGYKEVIFSVTGREAWDLFRHESGTHRVQRVPETESGGRVHTSAATVAVLLEAEESEVKIADNELKIDVYRSSGPGGQSVNTTDSAVRITHLPTGLVVICQDEKSQHKNKAKAMTVLRARLLERIEAEIHKEQSDTRRAQVGTGDRSERIRSYNFTENRVTDHRIKLTLYKLEQVMQGQLGDLYDALENARREALLAAATGNPLPARPAAGDDD